MSDKEEIRQRNDIVSVVATYVQLQRRGRNHVGLCPFHQEKTASFNVDPITQTFKCFGCGKGGDIFTFVELQLNMTFPEAAEHLARRVGLTFSPQGTGGALRASIRDEICRINDIAAAFYQTQLKQFLPAREYLTGRALDSATVRRFGLGYAPDSWDAITKFLLAGKHDLRLAATAGLVGVAQTGNYFDHFRNRIMFPIHDEQDRVVGFGGRALGDVQPKYLNTAETPAFSKSRLLYGLPFARRQITENKVVVLMEGYMDVIAAHQAGFNHTVATLGTSLTQEHAARLARLAPTVVLCYDADSAGIKATLRSSEILESAGARVRIVSLPAGSDPDSVLKSGDKSLLQNALNSASGRVEFQLDRVIAECDRTTADGQTAMLGRLVDILASIPTRSERDIYVDRVWRYHPLAASGASLAIDHLHRDADEIRRKVLKSTPRSRNSSTQDQPPPATVLTPEQRAERDLMRAIADPESMHWVLSTATEDDFLSDSGRRLFRLIQGAAGEFQSGELGLLQILDRYEEEAYSLAIREQLQEIHVELENIPTSLESVRGSVNRLRRKRAEQVRQETAILLRQCGTGAPLSAELRSRIVTLMQQQVSLESQQLDESS